VTPPGGTVQRSALTARVMYDPADALLATAANLSVGGLTVRLLREGTPATSATATADANGNVRFDNLLEGRYNVTVERVLSETEQSRFPAEDRDASVFAGGATVDVTPPQTASTKALVTTATVTTRSVPMWNRSSTPDRAPVGGGFAPGATRAICS
jgi:hypothetical protein